MNPVDMLPVDLAFHIDAGNYFFAKLSEKAKVIPYETEMVRFYGFAFRASAMAIRYHVKQNCADWYSQWNANLESGPQEKRRLWKKMGNRRGDEQHGGRVEYKEEWDDVPIHDPSVRGSIEFFCPPGTPRPELKRPRLEFEDAVPGSLVEQSKEYWGMIQSFVDAFSRDAPAQSRHKKTVTCPDCGMTFQTQ